VPEIVDPPNGNRAFSRDADSDLFEISEYRP
jgi:hypothetical protein